jgi:hypothetical protein
VSKYARHRSLCASSHLPAKPRRRQSGVAVPPGPVPKPAPKL